MSPVAQVGDPRTEPGWDDFVRAHDDATTYHLAAWSRIVSGAYRSSPRYLTRRDGTGALTGVMPLFHDRGLVSGARLSSIPVARVAGPLADAAGAAELVDAACRMADDAGVRQLVVRSHLEGLERNVEGLAAAPDQPTWVVALDPDVDAMRARVRKRSGNLAREIARAERDGVVVREAESDADVRSFYRLYLRTMRRHGALPRAYAQFRLERRELGDECRILLAAHGGRDLAAVIFHRFGPTFEALYGGTDERVRGVHASQALYWHAIRWAIEHGCRRLDMGGALPGSSLAAFKSRFTAAPVEIRRYTYVPGRPAPESPPGMPAAAGVGEDDGLPARAWRRLPLPVIRLAGTTAYRWL